MEKFQFKDIDGRTHEFNFKDISGITLISQKNYNKIDQCWSQKRYYIEFVQHSIWRKCISKSEAKRIIKEYLT